MKQTQQKNEYFTTAHEQPSLYCTKNIQYNIYNVAFCTINRLLAKITNSVNFDILLCNFLCINVLHKFQEMGCDLPCSN